MTDRAIMQQALDALEANLGNWAAKTKAIAALHERLAQPEQKPMHPTLQKMWEDYFDKCYKREPEQESFSPEAISATQAAWKMGYDAAKAEQPEQEPIKESSVTHGHLWIGDLYGKEKNP